MTEPEIQLERMYKDPKIVHNPIPALLHDLDKGERARVLKAFVEIGLLWPPYADEVVLAKAAGIFSILVAAVHMCGTCVRPSLREA